MTYTYPIRQSHAILMHRILSISPYRRISDWNSFSSMEKRGIIGPCLALRAASPEPARSTQRDRKLDDSFQHLVLTNHKSLIAVMWKRDRFTVSNSYTRLCYPTRPLGCAKFIFSNTGSETCLSSKPVT
ncbi:hypothetical protein FOWG_07466 [Fusarium oxysporum f. sp. lycopersici MN25]|nr:hypothetical protein FOWG_07466 [Fusarium oxysporum f. sp. lycopersici MN25]